LGAHTIHPHRAKFGETAFDIVGESQPMKNLPSTHQKRIEIALPFVGTHPTFFFFIVLAVSFANLLSQRLVDWQDFFVGSEIGFSLLALLMPCVALFLYKRTYSLRQSIEQTIDLPTETIVLWFDKQTESVFRGFWTYPAAVLVGLAAIWTWTALGIPWFGVVRFIFLLFWGLFMFVAGSVGWIYGRLLPFLYRLSNLPVKGEPFEWPEKGFKKINDVYLQMFIPGVCLYAGIIAALWASGGDWVALNHPLGRLWIFPVAGAVVGFFLMSQYCIHRLMARSKQRRLDEIDRLLKETYQYWLADRATDKSKTVTELLNWRSSINQEREWPLNLQSNFAIVTGLLLPTIKSVVDLLPR
jgi:hypothetical protein